MSQAASVKRLKIVIHGAVQGVGFRPFVYRLATELGLTGWVKNSSQGVFIEVEGQPEILQEFLLRLEPEKPPRSSIQSLESSFLDPVGYTSFEIRASDHQGAKTALILPDIATCPDCLREIFDPGNRRYRYPFTNCTNCGPRFSIIEALPYDRPNTTMKEFKMCSVCQAEYENPRDRRFHAQPNACPTCGPQVKLWDTQGDTVASHDNALRQTADAIRQGAILALKGLGGFHLLADARQEDTVRRLREGKHREEKPFASMYPTLELIKRHCEVSEIEERLLLSPEAPIVLLRRVKTDIDVAPSVAPRNPYLGVMLPYTPLHHLLMADLKFPIVATSGNLSDEPISTDEHEALNRLTGIAELFLIHNRPIARHVDDSIVRRMMGRELVLRRARGYAPLPILLRQEPSTPMLAMGAQLKNSIALSVGRDVFISQHIGDLETTQAYDAFRRVIKDFQRLYGVTPLHFACDAHPEYLSTKYARENPTPLVSVQHHIAHVAACMAENEIETPVLGVAWDGTGFGLDGTIWGGEFFRMHNRAIERVAHFRAFALPGGEQAIKEPRRSAIGTLYEVFGDALFAREDMASVQVWSTQESVVLQTMLKKKINTPRTSSVGRLFDAVAALTGLRQETKFEGQAAMELEFALDGIETDATYDFDIIEANRSAKDSSVIIDWEPMIRGIIAEVQHSVPIGTISAKFHNTLVETIVAIAKRMNEERIVLSGGCFQNKYLTERAVQRLREEGFRPYWHQRIPPNDGGIALGQIAHITNNR